LLNQPLVFLVPRLSLYISVLLRTPRQQQLVAVASLLLE
jgi:hypothetical protein